MTVSCGTLVARQQFPCTCNGFLTYRGASPGACTGSIPAPLCHVCGTYVARNWGSHEGLLGERSVDNAAGSEFPPYSPAVASCWAYSLANSQGGKDALNSSPFDRRAGQSELDDIGPIHDRLRGPGVRPRGGYGPRLGWRGQVDAGQS